MNKNTKALAAIAVYNSVIAGMEAENEARKYYGNAPAYYEDSFAVERDKFETALRTIQDIPEAK